VERHLLSVRCAEHDVVGVAAVGAQTFRVVGAPVLLHVWRSRRAARHYHGAAQRVAQAMFEYIIPTPLTAATAVLVQHQGALVTVAYLPPLLAAEPARLHPRGGVASVLDVLRAALRLAPGAALPVYLGADGLLYVFAAQQVLQRRVDIAEHHIPMRHAFADQLPRATNPEAVDFKMRELAVKAAAAIVHLPHDPMQGSVGAAMHALGLNVGAMARVLKAVTAVQAKSDKAQAKAAEGKVWFGGVPDAAAQALMDAHGDATVALTAVKLEMAARTLKAMVGDAVAAVVSPPGEPVDAVEMARVEAVDGVLSAFLTNPEFHEQRLLPAMAAKFGDAAAIPAPDIKELRGAIVRYAVAGSGFVLDDDLSCEGYDDTAAVQTAIAACPPHIWARLQQQHGDAKEQMGPRLGRHDGSYAASVADLLGAVFMQDVTPRYAAVSLTTWFDEPSPDDDGDGAAAQFFRLVLADFDTEAVAEARMEDMAAAHQHDGGAGGGGGGAPSSSRALGRQQSTVGSPRRSSMARAGSFSERATFTRRTSQLRRSDSMGALDRTQSNAQLTPRPPARQDAPGAERLCDAPFGVTDALLDAVLLAPRWEAVGAHLLLRERPSAPHAAFSQVAARCLANAAMCRVQILRRSPAQDGAAPADQKAVTAWGEWLGAVAGVMPTLAFYTATTMGLGKVLTHFQAVLDARAAGGAWADEAGEMFPLICQVIVPPPVPRRPEPSAAASLRAAVHLANVMVLLVVPLVSDRITAEKRFEHQAAALLAAGTALCEAIDADERLNAAMREMRALCALKPAAPTAGRVVAAAWLTTQVKQHGMHRLALSTLAAAQDVHPGAAGRAMMHRVHRLLRRVRQAALQWRSVAAERPPRRVLGEAEAASWLLIGPAALEEVEGFGRCAVLADEADVWLAGCVEAERTERVDIPAKRAAATARAEAKLAAEQAQAAAAERAEDTLALEQQEADRRPEVCAAAEAETWASLLRHAAAEVSPIQRREVVGSALRAAAATTEAELADRRAMGRAEGVARRAARRGQGMMPRAPPPLSVATIGRISFLGRRSTVSTNYDDQKRRTIGVSEGVERGTLEAAEQAERGRLRSVVLQAKLALIESRAVPGTRGFAAHQRSRRATGVFAPPTDGPPTDRLAVTLPPEPPAADLKQSDDLRLYVNRRKSIAIQGSRRRKQSLMDLLTVTE
jgi:hypothetical protein